jgi:hypothetical protein
MVVGVPAKSNFGVPGFQRQFFARRILLLSNIESRKDCSDSQPNLFGPSQYER